MKGWVTPSIPEGSIMIVMSVLGAVVMPHNLYLHSEVIQSRQWNLEDDKIIKKQLDFEFVDTLFSMGIGWAINSAMILLAAATFFKAGKPVDELQQAQTLLSPLVGNNASAIFAIALLFAGAASTITSAMAGGSIFAGIFAEPYDLKDNHSRTGVSISLLGAFTIILFIGNPFKALVISQMILSIQLPFTIFLQIYLTSSKKVMGKYANKKSTTIVLLAIGAIVTILNILLFISFF
jgi:manganese transport protein